MGSSQNNQYSYDNQTPFYAFELFSKYVTSKFCIGTFVVHLSYILIYFTLFLVNLSLF